MTMQGILDVYRTNALKQDTNLSWIYDRKRLQKLARAIDPSIRLYTKNNWFCVLLACILPVVTFGGMTYTKFLERYATTIGPLQFYPEHYSIKAVQRIILHESRHTCQARWCGLGIHPWVGLPVYALLYLFLPLPFFIAYPRLWFEIDASRYALRLKQSYQFWPHSLLLEVWQVLSKPLWHTNVHRCRTSSYCQG